MPTCRVLAALAVAVLVGGCGSTAIFHATFESDTAGAQPSTSPPEAPAGDSIYVSDVSGAGASQLAVVDSPALGGARSLRYANVDVPTYSRFVGFQGTEVAADPGADLFAFWIGRLQGTGSPLRIWLGDGSFRALAELSLANGTISRPVSGGPNPIFAPIGTYVEGGQHFVLLSVDAAARTWTVSVTQRGAPTVSSGPNPVLEATALGATRPTLYLWFSEETSGTATYVIDDIGINRRPPESPRP